MPTPNALLDVAIVLIDASFVGLWALVGLVLLGGAPEVLAEAWRWWRSR